MNFNKIYKKLTIFAVILTFSSLTAEKVNYVADFDGSDHIRIQNSPTLNFIGTDDFTISAWVRFPEGNINPQYFFAKGNTSVWHGISISCWNKKDTDINVSILLKDQTKKGVRGIISSVPRGVWTHIAFTVDRSNRLLKSYKNGILVQIKGIPSELDNFYHSIYMTLGYMPYVSWFTGKLDDFVLYNRVLPPAQVGDLKTYGPTFGDTSIMVYIPFEKITEKKFVDFSGKNNHADFFGDTKMLLNPVLTQSNPNQDQFFAGFVGIQTLVPEAELDVNGDVIIRGDATVDGKLRINAHGIDMGEFSEGEAP